MPGLRLILITRDIDTPVYPLLFDPQTAGGLLAGVPKPRLKTASRALHKRDYPDATIIGRIEPKSEEFEPIRLP